LKYVSLFLFVCILVLSCIATPAFANSIPIQNASFQTTNPLNISCGACGNYNLGPIPGWTTAGVAGSWQPGPASFSQPLPNGGIVAVVNNGGSISQALGVSLLSNTLYNLSVDVGQRLDGPNGYASNFIIQLFAGSTLLNSIAGFSGAIPMGTFATQSFTYLAGNAVPSGNLSIVLGTAGQQSVFANVQLTATSVSEPGSLTLLAAGLGLALFVFRRR
jgi:hypothetical protein